MFECRACATACVPPAAPDARAPKWVIPVIGPGRVRLEALSGTQASVRPYDKLHCYPLGLIDVDGVVSLFGFPHLPPAGLSPTA